MPKKAPIHCSVGKGYGRFYGAYIGTDYNRCHTEKRCEFTNTKWRSWQAGTFLDIGAESTGFRSFE